MTRTPIDPSTWAPRRRRRDWRTAREALKRLLDDPSQTQNAFLVIDALDGDPGERVLRILLAHSEGRRLLLERPALLPHLQDRDALRALPADTFGRAYLTHIERYGLDPARLVELRRQTDPRADKRDPTLAWIMERSVLTHDLCHVLAGLGADELGEALLLPFSLAQSGGFGFALLTVGASLRMRPLLVRALWQSWRSGRRAVPLAALPYESLLDWPLDEVRRAARVTPVPIPAAGASAR